MNTAPDDKKPEPVPFSELGDELLECARETAEKIKERVRKVTGDAPPGAETREMDVIDTKEMPVVPPEQLPAAPPLAGD